MKSRVFLSGTGTANISDLFVKDKEKLENLLITLKEIKEFKVTHSEIGAKSSFVSLHLPTTAECSELMNYVINNRRMDIIIYYTDKMVLFRNMIISHMSSTFEVGTLLFIQSSEQ